MDSENMKSNQGNHKELKKCEFCHKELTPIGLDYYYYNISADSIKYERCDCSEAQAYWKKKDEEEYQNKKKNHYKEIINNIYKQNYIGKKFQEKKFENFKTSSVNEKEINIAKNYTQKCLTQKQDKGLIISGEFGVGKTHLAAAIANELVENGMIVLMGRLTTLLDIIKETFRDNNKSESELIDLYSNVDMLVIDDLGTEKISQWALEKLYTIIENRNENKLPIIITTRFNKQGLVERFKNQDPELVDAIISKLYQMCYGITLKNIKEKELV